MQADNLRVCGGHPRFCFFHRFACVLASSLEVKCGCGSGQVVQELPLEFYAGYIMVGRERESTLAAFCF